MDLCATLSYPSLNAPYCVSRESEGMAGPAVLLVFTDACIIGNSASVGQKLNYLPDQCQTGTAEMMIGYYVCCNRYHEPLQTSWYLYCAPVDYKGRVQKALPIHNFNHLHLVQSINQSIQKGLSPPCRSLMCLY